jgi:hypothetical protein
MSEWIPVALRRQVRERARLRCEYCLLHEEDSEHAHELDHIRARRHGGETAAENLALACFRCNDFKGSNLASVDPETDQVVLLFNPRADEWANHFRLEEGRIAPLTPQGRATEFFLRLNSLNCIELRRALMAVGRYPR